MKAIQIRYLAATNTKGFRYKAFTKNRSLTKERPNNMEDQDFIKLLANDFIKKFDISGSIIGIVLLPCDDWCAIVD